MKRQKKILRSCQGVEKAVEPKSNSGVGALGMVSKDLEKNWGSAEESRLFKLQHC